MVLSDIIRKRCEEIGVNDVFEFDNNIDELAEVAIQVEDQFVPIFYIYRELTLPIVSLWIIKKMEVNRVFCRISFLVSKIPSLIPLVQYFLESNPKLNLDDEDVLMAIIRVLNCEFRLFSPYFSGELIREAAARNEGYVKTKALATLSVLMEVGEMKFNEWVQDYTESDAASFEFDAILKEAHTSSKLECLHDAHRSTDQSYLDSFEFQNSLVVRLGHAFLPRYWLGSTSDVSFVETETSMNNLHSFVDALLKSRPVLLLGPSGSGKSKLVEYVHSKVHGGELVRIHLGDQTDSKGLVGAYASGAEPGTFEWRNGALASAVESGKWVLIEDIDRAPSDVTSILLPLLERRELVLPSRDQIISAAPGFQIVATCCINELGSDRVEVVGERLWSKAHTSPVPDTDLELIALDKLQAGRSDSRTLIKTLVNAYHRVLEYQHLHRFTRTVTVSDLLKVASRIKPEYDADDFYLECVSCFAAFSIYKKDLAAVIADATGMSASRGEIVLYRRDPSVILHDAEIRIGRAALQRRVLTLSASRKVDYDVQQSNFALTKPTKQLLEEIAVSVEHSEPVLLVGESGTGKTAVVQYLASTCRRKLVVINVSQQVESGDLIGGFKPMDLRQSLTLLLEDFYEIFDSTFSRAKNNDFINTLDKAIKKSNYKAVVKLFKEAVRLAMKSSKDSKESSSNSDGVNRETKSKRKRLASDSKCQQDWYNFNQNVDMFDSKLSKACNTPQFEFVNGLLVNAIQKGYWLLLDELNLAPADTIEGISELVSSRAITILDNKGEVVRAHENFRLFANMNPATDVGKKDLPSGVRSLFTELWAPGPDEDLEALRIIISKYLPSGTSENLITKCSELFTESRRMAATHEISDGAGQKPHFSMRTLARMLASSSKFAFFFGLQRGLFESFQMCFVTLLDEPSAKSLSELAKDKLFTGYSSVATLLSQKPKQPSEVESYIQVGYFFIKQGPHSVIKDASYILTETVAQNLNALARAASLKSFPVLLQGPTSSGKTSMVTYLAQITGHRVVRINNHEHTDLAEYIGGYESDSNGTLVFKEGALVQALRNGDWLILDELNLAPSDVLEALNRLLDDNRELLVPETQEYVRPHPDFVLFATQNPADGNYAGRKMLSRAFRSRFLELHFGDIPESELDIILRDRTLIAPSYAKKIVEVYQELSRMRSIARVFETPATLRDLFRWASRIASGDISSYDAVATAGFQLLGERARTDSERHVVRDVLTKILKADIPDAINVNLYESPEMLQAMSLSPPEIVWTNAMKRLLYLTLSAFAHNEAVILVGETGCGKTTVVQALAESTGKPLITVNAHQNTETSDLVGSQRPCRGDSKGRLFEWVDGPLVKAMKEGCVFLLDEISLADDSVLERLNSVLESGRILFVPEIGRIEAAPGFQFVATMNPGGDYGKKELSPALRNRFTEIWVPPALDRSDLKMAVSRVLPDFNDAVEVIVEFSLFVKSNIKDHRFEISLRDVLSWAVFVSLTGNSLTMVSQGAFMTFIDRAKKSDQQLLCSKLKELINDDSVNFQDYSLKVTPTQISAGPFSLPRLDGSQMSVPFSLEAPTSALNAMRVLRAMRALKPILIEGPPGAGKTSLITALANICNVRLARLNLSEQTDLTDLFGQDQPLTEPGQFAWRSAPFLRAMEQGEWVLLDEMNLAPQQVLEGLNACLDHRGEAFVPELNRTFKKHPEFRVFAAQNPQAQGGGRKGLPKSFVSRFTCVYVDQLNEEDLALISSCTHPNISVSLRSQLSSYIEALENWSTDRVMPGQPFEFNLRDTLRWLDLLTSNESMSPVKYLPMIVLQRLRTAEDRNHAENLLNQYLPDASSVRQQINPVVITPGSFCVNEAALLRSEKQYEHSSELAVLSIQQPLLESMIWCIQQAWPILLVGPSGSGKTSMIRLLSKLSGSRLHEFAITADLDASDLLGEFDQVEKEAEWYRMWKKIGSIINGVDIAEAELVDAVRAKNLANLERLLSKNHPCYELVKETVEKYTKERFDLPKFKWFDGMLVSAIENGDWVVLDNANLCAPSVLDRLNSLLERNGKLYINECSDSDGNPRVITPHPNFRMFMTVNPKFGELSRAMRNRSVELWTGDLVTRTPTVSTSLNLDFPRPLNLCRLLDLQSLSWLSALPIDDFSCSYAKNSGIIDADYVEFLSLKSNDVNQLYVDWNVLFFTKMLSRILASVRNQSFKPKSLLELSVYQKSRSEDLLNFDLYGIILLLIEMIPKHPSLSTIIPDLCNLNESSRIPVFRSYLLQYSRDNDIKTLETAVINRLGNDDSKRGMLMPVLWQKFGRKFGFKDIDAFKMFSTVQKLYLEFDALVDNMGTHHINEISEVRKYLALTNTTALLKSDIDRLCEAIEDFKHNLPSSENVYDGLLVDNFEQIWNLLSLTRASAVDVEWNSKSISAMSKLISLAKKSTLNLAEEYTNNELNIPSIAVGEQVESILLNVIQKTEMGQSKDELAELSRIILEQSNVWKFAIDPQQLVKRVTSRFISSMQSLEELRSPQSESIEFLEIQKALNSNDVIEHTTGAACMLLQLYVPDYASDPAIAQHVWYERFIRLQQEFAKDNTDWENIKAVFGGLSDDVDAWLANRVLKHEPVPDIWRPQFKQNSNSAENYSEVDLVHRDMLAARNLAEDLIATPRRSLDQVELSLVNSKRLLQRLERIKEYRDLVRPALCAMRLLNLGLSLQWQLLRQKNQGDSNDHNLWLLNPMSVCLNPVPVLASPLLSLRAMCCTRSLRLQYVEELLNNIYQKWTLERLQLEERKREESAGFRYNDDIDSEEAAEREFKRLFPDFDDDYVLADNNEANFAAELTSLYCSIFLDDFRSPESGIVSTITKAATSLKSAYGNSDASHLLALLLVIQERSRPQQVLTSSEINFYTDPSPVETVLSLELCKKVLLFVSPLLKMWPEHDTLITLQRISTEIGEIPPGAPIALRLSKVEQLYHYIHEWDRFASKEVKCGALMADTAALIVKWRRLELATWTSLFAVEKQKAADSASAYWFHLFETLIAVPIHDIVHAAKVLVVFLADSTVGQFERRLHMLKAFEKHLSLTGKTEVVQCVSNVRKFYTQFLPHIQQRLEVAETQLRKQVDEVVKLASWRDTNIHALKQSAQKSHRQLFKVVKKYRAALESPAIPEESPLISPDYNELPMPQTDIILECFNEKMKPLEVFDLWNNRPKQLYHLDTTCARIRDYANCVNGSYPNRGLADIASEAVTTAADLHKRTPKVWNKDTKKTINSLKMEKQVFLTYVLRELRGSGLRTSVRKATMMQQNELIKVLALNPTFENESWVSSADNVFFAFIELLTKLRATLSEADNSVPKADLQRGMAYAENSFSYILKLRKCAAGHLRLNRSDDSISVLEELCSRPIKACFRHAEVSSLVLDSAFAVKSFGEVSKEFVPTSTLKKVMVDMEKAYAMSTTEMASHSSSQWFEDTLDSIHEVHLSLDENDSGRMLLPSLATLAAYLEDKKRELPLLASSNTATDIIAMVFECANIILVVIQQIVSAVRSFDKDEDKEWFKKSCKFMISLLESLRSNTIWTQIDKVTEHILSLSNKSDLHVTSALAATMLVFVNGYRLVTLEVEKLFKKFLYETSVGSFKLSKILYSLATVGFCSPEPTEDDSDSEVDDKGDNAGLGDGQGENSTSKDIDEEDDDVAESMQSANPDQEERDEAEEDNAKDVEGDLAGEIEDAPPNNSEEEGDSSDNDQEPEDEVGDLDELDPNAVDEKMWDDEHEENDTGQKEKESQEKLNGAKDDAMEGVEEANDNMDPDNEADGQQTDDNAEDKDDEDNSEEIEDNQDDNINQGDKEQVQPEIEQNDALNLPDDLQLDSGSEKDQNEDENVGLSDSEDEMINEKHPEDLQEPDDPTSDRDAEGSDIDVSDVDHTDDATNTEEEEAEEEKNGDIDSNDIENNQSDLDDNSEVSDMEVDMPDGDVEASASGLGGVDDENQPNQDLATIAEDRTEKKGQGDVGTADNEEDNIGTGGTTGSESVNPDRNIDENEQRTQNSLKQLGDALKEFHRRKREIKDFDPDAEQNDNARTEDETKPVEANDFEHVGADEAHDTQALGKSTNEIKQDVDNEMAVDDDQEEVDKEVAGDDDNSASLGANNTTEEATAALEDGSQESDNESSPTIVAGRTQELSLDNSDALSDIEATEELNHHSKYSEDNTLWQYYESKTHDLAMILGEQLRLILEPTVASKLKGDYRTGKRLNMKRIIPYIASEFRKDKIWLRRTKPAKREYQVLLALDDSKSMAEPAVVDLAFQAIAVVGKALNTVEAGQMGIARFGSNTDFIHPLSEPFNADAGNRVLQKFTFSQNRTDVNRLLSDSLSMFQSTSNSSEQWKLEIIISDGIADDHLSLKKLVRKATDERVMLVFIILDALNKETSILDMNEAKYTADEFGSMKLEVSKYMDDFPFDYYVIVRNISDLPSVLATVLRQYFQSLE